jgi:hypothetical protein
MQSRGGAPVSDEKTTYIATAYIASPGYSFPVPPKEVPRDVTTTVVSYANRTWYEGSARSAGSNLLLNADFIRNQIASGQFTVAGRQPLQGHDAIKLTWSVSGTTAGGDKTTAIMALWVDAHTYAPLQLTATDTTPIGKYLGLDFTEQYRFLPAIKANLALLTPPIPAGFTRATHIPQVAGE